MFQLPSRQKSRKAEKLTEGVGLTVGPASKMLHAKFEAWRAHGLSLPYLTEFIKIWEPGKAGQMIPVKAKVPGDVWIRQSNDGHDGLVLLVLLVGLGD